MVDKNKIFPGAIVWALHEGKERPHLALKVTDASEDVFLIQVAVMSSKKPLQLDGNYKISAKSNIHLYRLLELKLKDIVSIDKNYFNEEEYNEIRKVLIEYIKNSYEYGM